MCPISLLNLERESVCGWGAGGGGGESELLTWQFFLCKILFHRSLNALLPIQNSDAKLKSKHVT